MNRPEAHEYWPSGKVPDNLPDSEPPVRPDYKMRKSFKPLTEPSWVVTISILATGVIIILARLFNNGILSWPWQ